MNQLHIKNSNDGDEREEVGDLVKDISHVPIKYLRINDQIFRLVDMSHHLKNDASAVKKYCIPNLETLFEYIRFKRKYKNITD